MSELSEPIYVPAIFVAEIAEMRHIEPLIRVPDSEWYQRIKGQETLCPTSVSYLWNAEPAGDRLAFSPLSRQTIVTFHKYGAPALFKPSLAEVYAAIRRFMPNNWRQVKYFCLRSEDLGSDNVIGCCHWCKCDLFGDAANA